MELLIAIGIYIAGFVTGVFVYRNNTKSADPIADRIDEVADKVADKLKGK